MELALYHPRHGYYARGPAALGRDGDYYTASDVGATFGRVLARQISELDSLLGEPSPFRYVEYAAGRGLLARDVLDALARSHAGLAARCTATLVDVSDGMREAASARVPEARVFSPGEAPLGGAGCVVAVELLDALPVRRVRRGTTRLSEIRVDTRGGELVEVETPADPEVVAWADAHGAAPEPGDEAEVSLRLATALADLAGAIDRGFVIVVDYGFDARQLYGPAHRRGTLLAYSRHAPSEDYLVRVGQQDLTAHVNFSALATAAGTAGLTPLGWTTQERFLIANGILADLASEEADDSLLAVKRRLQVKQLIHPDGMGRAFKVAMFARGVDPARVPSGLEDPFA